jgi:hypothetical protein
VIACDLTPETKSHCPQHGSPVAKICKEESSSFVKAMVALPAPQISVSIDAKIFEPGPVILAPVPAPAGASPPILRI